MKVRAIIPLITATALGVSLLASHANNQSERKFLANGPLPPVPIPADNPQTNAKISLGRQLYFEGRLSSDGTISCASCHDPKHAWADTESVSAGVAHKLGKRNSPSIINAAYIIPQFWDGRAVQLEKQAVGPVQNPIEMDLTEKELNHRLNHIPGYVTQFQAVFGAKPNIDLLAKAIASFERTIISNDSPYDKYLKGDKTALSVSALRGLQIFNGKGGCTNCHSGPAFSDSSYHNLGVGYVNGKYKDPGRYDVTMNPSDVGAFLTQKLRCVELTPPYMHDGSVPTLEGVIELYDRGGVPNPHLDKDMKPLHLTTQEKSDLVAFLKSLTGTYPIMGPPPLPNPEITAQKLSQMMKSGVK